MFTPEIDQQKQSRDAQLGFRDVLICHRQASSEVVHDARCRKRSPPANRAPDQGGVVNGPYAASCFLYGPRFAGTGAAASISAARSSMDHSLSVTFAAIAGVTRSVLWMRQKL